MIKLINRLGGTTWIKESRVDEYLSLGYKLVEVEKAETTEATPEKATKKKTTKRTTRKR